MLIKRVDWADEFKKLNQVSEYEFDLKLIEELKKKRNQAFKNSGIMGLIWIPRTIIFISNLSLAVGAKIIAYNVALVIVIIIFLLLIGAITFFLIKAAYYVIKIENVED